MALAASNRGMCGSSPTPFRGYKRDNPSVERFFRVGEKRTTFILRGREKAPLAAALSCQHPLETTNVREFDSCLGPLASRSGPPPTGLADSRSRRFPRLDLAGGLCRRGRAFPGGGGGVAAGRIGTGPGGRQPVDTQWDCGHPSSDGQPPAEFFLIRRTASFDAAAHEPAILSRE